jgi:hypothetical protein
VVLDRRLKGIEEIDDFYRLLQEELDELIVQRASAHGPIILSVKVAALHPVLGSSQPLEAPDSDRGIALSFPDVDGAA